MSSCSDPSERESCILQKLSYISGPDAFSNKNSSQYQALDWLVNNDELKLSSDDDTLVQRYVLAVLYFETNGDEWFNCTRFHNSSCAFLSAAGECRWGGIGCDDTNSVARINIDKNNLNGPIPTEMGALSRLDELDLAQNALIGTIPGSIASLSELIYLDLDMNNLVGPIPEGIYDLPSLAALDLDTNQLTGTISSRIGQLSNLYVAQFDKNKLTGTIPTEIGGLLDLGYLTIFGNSFSDGVPQQVCDSQALVYASCSVCTIDGCCADCL
jgi:Leucine-rich repeat (LRR) protein